MAASGVQLTTVDAYEMTIGELLPFIEREANKNLTIWKAARFIVFWLFNKPQNPKKKEVKKPSWFLKLPDDNEEKKEVILDKNQVSIWERVDKMKKRNIDPGMNETLKPFMSEEKEK